MDPLQVVYEGRFVRMVRRENWEFVQRRNVSGVVGILALTEEGRMLMVEQHRPPLGKRVIEIPAGLAGDVVGSEREELAEAAKRELEEETGYRAARMEYLAEGAASAGLTDELITLFRASGLSKVGDGGGDEHEDIAVYEVPVNQVIQFLAERIQAGAMVDLKVYSALYFAR